MYSSPLYSGQCAGSRISSNLDSHVFKTVFLEYNSDMYAGDRWDTPLTRHAAIICEHGTCNSCGTQQVQVTLVRSTLYMRPPVISPPTVNAVAVLTEYTYVVGSNSSADMLAAALPALVRSFLALFPHRSWLGLQAICCLAFSHLCTKYELTL